MRLKLSGFALAALATLLSPAAFAMNCKLASTTVDKLICADPDILAADQQLNEAYRIDLTVHDNPKSVAEEQRYWLKSIRNRCTDAACLKEVYRRRLADIHSTTDCTRPANENETLVCSAHNEQDLGKLIADRLNEWRPYLAALPDLPRDPVQRTRKWDASINASMVPPESHCRTFDCRRAETARYLEEDTFPKEVYEKFLTWIDSNGQRSPFMDADRWTLKDSEAQPLWKRTSDGQISYIGNPPKWLRPDEDGYILNSPDNQPPFLDRRLTDAEASNLRAMVSRLDPYSSSASESIAGVSMPIMHSVVVDDGGTGHCSPNPLYNSIDVETTFPPSGNTTRMNRFKIIELLSSPVEPPVPTCSTDGGDYPDGFYDGSTSSNIVIGGIPGDPFVRPDGTFWLKFPGGEWVRFRRDMTSDAKGITPPFIVLSEDEFDKMRDSSKTIGELNARLKQRFSTTNVTR
jgi:uncharacterized protein